MRTRTTKEVEHMTFDRLSTWSIIAGVSKVLYGRYSTEMWATAFFVSIGFSVWSKLG